MSNLNNVAASVFRLSVFSSADDRTLWENCENNFLRNSEGKR